MTRFLAPLLLLFSFATAHADTPATAGSGVPVISAPVVNGDVVDPIATAQSGNEAAWASIETYGPIWGGALLLFGVAGAFIKRNNIKHWIAEGKTLALITTGTMLLAAALEWKFRGGDTAGLLMSIFLAIKMLVSPTVTPPTTPAPAPIGGGTGTSLFGGAAILMLVAFGLAASQAACHYDQVKADAKQVAAGAVVCAKADVPAIKALGSQLAMEALASVLAGNGIPWKQLQAEAEAGAKAQGIEVGSCAFGQLIADLSKLLPPPKTQSLLASVPDDGRAELADFKRQLGVTRIDLANGEVL